MVTGEKTSSKLASLSWTLTRTPLLLAKHLWVWPVVGAVIISLVGIWVRDRVDETTRAELASRLQTLLNADIAALRLWLNEQKADAKSFAADVRIREAIIQLAEMSKETNVAAATLINSEQAQTLVSILKPLLENQHYLDYVVVGANKRILASPRRYQVGRTAPPEYELFLKRALMDQLAVSRPFAAAAAPASQRAEGPTMFVAAPVKATNGTIVAVLGLRMKPEAEFSSIFSVARMGFTGESYAFDRRGVMLTASRFEGQLRQLGLITNSPDATSILNLKLSDPGVDLQNGERPVMAREDMPLTRMAESATRGNREFDVQGYRNYRGEKVVGAWAWLPEFNMGVATEVGVNEAFENLYTLRRAFLVLFVLLLISAVGIFSFTLLVERLQASVRKSALTLRRLGQYVLVQEIGRGANGMVYRARHALLRRPVAIKLLSPDMTNEANAARFEREVQMTSQLTHPNTVAIYDYGRTPEGLFYYAMEFLGGIELDQLVRQFGPQPEGRVIHILRQVCGSLAEAHGVGLIHRDIKPANVVLTRRGGVYDVVKVLDFGLVKAQHLNPTDSVIATAVVGTPHFMSPEAIERPDSVDARGDLYSLGAVGYWLLTGQTLFRGEKVEVLLNRQVSDEPMMPSELMGKPVSPDLERLIMQCLAKAPDARPPSAAVLEEALARCAAAGTWTVAMAAEWWQVNAGTFEPTSTGTMAEKTLVIVPRA
jgi:tRNA A-37 threonylcarbamoyl transferase component Bud32